MDKACREAGLPRPEFVEVAGRLRVVIRAATATARPAVSGADDLLRVLASGEARTSEIATALGKSIRWTRLRLNELVDNGLIVELGKGPNDPRRRYALPAAHGQTRYVT